MSRVFAAHSDSYVQLNSPYLLPLIDLINHSTDVNVKGTLVKGVYVVTALKSIRKGEGAFARGWRCFLRRLPELDAASQT